MVANLYEKISILDSEVKKINSCPLDAVLEPDENGYIARTAEIPLYGVGDTPEEAIEMLKREVESLYDDLQEGEQFAEDWLGIKRFLTECIAG